MSTTSTVLTSLEINVGFVPLDQYGSLNTNNVYFPNCPSTYTVKQCYMLQ
jgi:hypothetical protein